MGVYGGPKISSDGLVLSLDAANLKGYDKFENLTLDTSQIGLTPTYSVGGIVGLNTTATTDPNGGNQASLLDNNGNVNNYVYGSAAVGLTTNTTYTYSIHIKQGTKPDFQITIDENGFGGKRYFATFTYSTETVVTGITGGANDGVVVGSTTTKLTNGWYRLALSFRTSTASVSGFIDMINRFGNTSGSNYVWGRQLEKGSSVTDYYATTGTIKNRGTIWTDLSSRGNNGTLTNGPTFNSANGGSIVFDGTNDYALITNPTNIQNQNFTISTWVNPGTQNLGLVSMIDFDHGGSNGWVLQSEDATTNRYYYLAWWNGTQFQPTGGGGFGAGKGIQLTTSVWQNIVYSKSETSLLGYINGNQVYTGTATNSNVVYGSNKNLSIGDWVPLGRTFKGNISNTQIYNRALTAEEIRQNYIATKSRYGL